jgi:hypothetical protein
MIKPQEMFCDFCSNPIAEGSRFTKIVVPIPPTTRKALIEHCEQQILPVLPQARMFPGMVNAENLIPREWVIEMCAGCTTGLLGTALEKMQEQIKTAIDRNLRMKRADELSAKEFESEPEF